MLIGLMRFLVRFAEIKVENGLTWFFDLLFEEKKNEIWTYVFFFSM